MKNPRYLKKLKKILTEKGIHRFSDIQNLEELKRTGDVREFFQDMQRHRRYRRLAELMVTYPWWTVTVVMIVTLLFSLAMLNLEVDPDPWKMVPDHDPAVEYWEEVKDLFGSSDNLIVAVVSPDTIFSETTLAKVDELTDRLERLTVTDERDVAMLEKTAKKYGGELGDLLLTICEDGLDRSDRGDIARAIEMAEADPDVKESVAEKLEDIRIALTPLDDIVGISTVEHIDTVGGVLYTDPLMEGVPGSADELSALAERLNDNDMLKDGMVSSDNSATLIFSALTFEGHPRRTIALKNAIDDITDELGGPEEYYMSGVPIILTWEAIYMENDMLTLVPAVIILIMVILFIVFRNVRGMMTPLMVVVISVIWTLGLMALVKVPLSIITTAMPVILVAIGCADGIHIITEYYGRLSQGVEKRTAIVDTMEEISSPVIMTSLTSMAGFGSLVTSSLGPIREFGVFTAFGIFAAMIFSLTFIPAMMMILAPPKRIGRAVERTDRPTPLSRFLDTVTLVTVKKKRLVVLAMIPLFVFVVFMTSRVDVGYGFMRDFRKSSEIRISDDVINEKFPGSISINVILDTGSADGAKDPEFLEKVALLQERLGEDPLVGDSTSIVDFIDRMNYVMHDKDPAYNRLPKPVERVVVETDGEEEIVEEVSGRDLVAQYLLLYENSGGEDIEKVVDFEYRLVNVVFQLKTSYSREIIEIQKEAHGYIDEIFTDGTSGHLSGVGDLIVIISNYIVRSQLISLVTSICVVLLMLFIVFRSFKAGIFSMLPLVFTILANFTIMKCFGINLDVATAMIASMALGIGIDYAIHFVTRYRIEVFLKNKTPEEAVSETIHTTGRAIIFNALAVAAGFLVLIFSHFIPIMNIGWLVAATMLISSLVTIVLLPALITLFGLDDKILKNVASLIAGALKN